MKMLYKLPVVIGIILFSTSISQSQINPAKGYDHDIGNMVSMLESLRARVIGSVEGLNQEQTDFLLDDKANRIGAMIMHLAATEVYYQALTFENRQLNEEEIEKWGVALSLGDEARAEFIDKPIGYYLEAWTQVRVKTNELLKIKDDKWFSSKIKGSGTNNHWAWFHVMEHQANHMGQINMLRSRLPE